MSKQCRCPLWFTGTLFGKPYRKSAKTRSFEAAEKIKRNIEDDNQADKRKELTIKDALAAFIRDCESRNLNKSTLAKYRLLERTLNAWCATHLILNLADCRIETIRDFRGGRKHSPSTASKELERLRAFFKFCVDNDWIKKNPAKAIKAPITDPSDVAPFPAKMQQKILDTAYRLSLTQIQPKERVLPVHPKTGTFIKLLLNSGLRITDAATLEQKDLSDGRLMIRAGKNKATISIALPPDLITELEAIKTTQLFQSPLGSTRPETISDYWRDQINKVFDHMGIEAHPHQFRHSLVMNMLHAGSSIEDAARVIGDSPKTVATHYWKYCIDTNTRIDDQLKKTWKTRKPQLALVK